MISKAIEIRDSMTFIPALVINTAPANEGQRYLLRRAGYAPDGETVIVVKLTSGEARNDPYEWLGSRTMQVAHMWLLTHFSEIDDGAVIDVEFILGETAAAKRSERTEVAV